MFFTLVADWRQRNNRWAAEHLSPEKADLFRRQWGRISRFHPLFFSAFVGLSIALIFEIMIVGCTFGMWSIPMEARVMGLYIMTLGLFPTTFIAGSLLGLLYYHCIYEYAKLQPGKII